jgi:transposase-like protein
MAKQQRTFVRYSISFKQKVVREIEVEGLSHTEAARRYGIKGGSTIRQWLILFGKNDLLNKVVRVEMKGEKDRLKELQTEVQRLKLALADATLEKQALKTLLTLVEEHYGIDVKNSDRGIQYCSKDYVALLKKEKMMISMTEENHCYENSMAERVNGILKDEFLLDEQFKDTPTARRATKQAIETYNTRRPHWSLNLATPEEVHHKVGLKKPTEAVGA